MLISNILPDNIVRTYFDMLCLKNWKEFEPMTLIVCAHPDDETIGMGSRLKKITNAKFVYITDGAPKNQYYYTKAGFFDNVSYAKARKEELFKALAFSDFTNSDCIFLNIRDQEASFNIPGIIDELVKLFASYEPDAVFTHSYEGGHPDHDSTSLAVQIALQKNLIQNGYAPVTLEFASYYGENSEIVTNKFRDVEYEISREVILSEEEKNEKIKMINCFVSQRDFLKIFSTDIEMFRQAPDYDFTTPPYNGKLYYEQFDWGITGEKWRKNAARILNLYGLSRK